MPPPDALETAGLLQDAANFIRRYVVLGNDELVAIALWVGHTYTWDTAHTPITPYLAVLSPEKRSGKTTLVEVLSLIVNKPLQTANASDAALFRSIAAEKPTLLMDEVDAVFNPKSPREDLRGLLNSGQRRGGVVLRCGGKNMTELEKFECYCPKLLAGIGLSHLPDTIADRSIIVQMARKAAADKVQRFRIRQVSADADVLRQRFESWATAASTVLEFATPALPDELDDRAQDAWEPLLAIADMAGDQWAQTAREAARRISKITRHEDDSIRLQLLAGIRRVFADREGDTDADRIATRELITALAADEEGPFVKWCDGDTPHQWAPRALSKHLKEHGILTTTLRFASGQPAKGYRLEQFTEAFARYLPEKSVTSVAAVTPVYPSQKSVTAKSDVTDACRYNPHLSVERV